MRQSINNTQRKRFSPHHNTFKPGKIPTMSSNSFDKTHRIDIDAVLEDLANSSNENAFAIKSFAGID